MCYNPYEVKNMENRKNDVDPFLHDASRALVDMAERLSEIEQRPESESKKRDKNDRIMRWIGIATLLVSVAAFIKQMLP